jgi:hypothetical protein
MDEIQYLLNCLSEECAEVQQRVSKALRFGLKEIQPGQPLDNIQRIEEELIDVAAIISMLRERGVYLRGAIPDAIAEKKEKVLETMILSERQGILKR